MSATVLQVFNRASLIDLEGEDTRLTKLQEAAAALAVDFGMRPVSMAIPALMAILRDDSQNPGDAFEDTARAIESHWNTYQSVFRDGKATTLYRGVALQALVEAMGSHPPLGTAVALLMRNFRTAIEFGKYAPAIQLLVDAAEAAFKQECKTETAPASEASTPLPAAAMAPKVERTALQKRIEAAVGPHNRAGQAAESPNANWPNAGNPWSHDFSDRLTVILADYIDIAMGEAAKLDGKIQQGVGDSLAEHSRIDPVVKQSTMLLWWRQALYSESAEQSYRSLGPCEAVIHAVVDLSALLPEAYERAVDSFLSEAILALGIGKETREVGQLQSAAATATSALKGSLQLQSPAGLVMTAVLYKDGAIPVCAPSLLSEEWAVWLLRELMAIRAVEELQKATEDEDGVDV